MDIHAAQGKEGQDEVVENADGGREARNLKGDASEPVVDGKFPGCVRVPVQENPLADLAGAGTYGRNVGALLFGKQRINGLAVKHKVEDEQQEAQHTKQDAQEGLAEKEQAAEDVAEGGKIEVSVKGIRMLLKGFGFHIRAAAFFLQYPGEILRRGPLACAAG